jgi:hypothetical protein
MTIDIVDDTDRLFRGIGKVVVQFQFIESTLSEILASLLQLREQSDNHRVAAAMSYRQKVDLMCDLYAMRKHPQWPSVDISITRKALFAAEDFRNRVVHSFWHVGGSESQWMRTKASLRSNAGLKVATGAANIENLELGAKSLYVVRDWYLGQSEKLTVATQELRIFAAQLSSADEMADEF